MIRCNRLVLVMAVAVSAPLAAQRTDSDSREMARLPAAPADHILDVADLFKRRPERREAVSERLLALQSEYELPVYLAVYGTIIDSSPPHRARLLYDRWIGPDRDGVVILVEADTLRSEVVTPGGEFAKRESGPPTRLPDYRMIEILAELRVTLEGVEDRVDFADRTVEIVTTRIEALLREKSSGAGLSPTTRFALVTVLVGIVLALLGILVNRRLRIVEERARERFYFPSVMVGTRLGAPYAGGRHSVVDFSRNRTRPQ